MSIIKRIQAWDSRKRRAANEAIMAHFTVEGAERFVSWYDHGFFRRFWSNFHEIAPGVFRSNYPSSRRFPEIKAKGIHTIISLRGGEGSVTHRLEQELCQQHDITLHLLNLNARKAPDRDELLKLLDLFDALETPFLMHCKSGADRAGLASAMYLIHANGASVADARKMLSLKYLHVNDRKTGIMGHILTEYEAANAESPLTLRQWLTDQYDPIAAQKAFDISRRN